MAQPGDALVHTLFYGICRLSLDDPVLRYYRDIDSLFPFLIGMTLAIGGWKALRWAWPSILFLLFMVPPPDRVSKAMAIVCNTGPQ